MIKFLLILILFHPIEGRYKDAVSAFETKAECLRAQAQVRKIIRPEPGVIFVLTCQPTKPTDGTEI